MKVERGRFNGIMIEKIIQINFLKSSFFDERPFLIHICNFRVYYHPWTLKFVTSMEGYQILPDVVLAPPHPSNFPLKLLRKRKPRSTYFCPL